MPRELIRIGHVEVSVVRGSVLDQPVEAIVNAANTSMRGGSGVDGAIHRAASKTLVEELMRLAPGGCKAGRVVVTGGHALPFKHIFHTPGPYWQGGDMGEPEILEACYTNCLVKAGELSVRSIAFCSIATGIYGFPLALAAPIAIETTVRTALAEPATSLQSIIFAMFGEEEFLTFSTELERRR